MPIYMIMPRYSHNYALFYQLLDSNLFIHHNTYAILREATSETYGPRVYLLSYTFPISFSLHSLLSIYIIKIPKIFILLLLFLSDLTLVSDPKGIDKPWSRWLRSSYLFMQVRGTDAWSPSGLIPWFSKTKGNTYATLLHHPFLFKGKPMQCSTGSSWLYRLGVGPCCRNPGGRKKIL